MDQVKITDEDTKLEEIKVPEQMRVTAIESLEIKVTEMLREKAPEFVENKVSEQLSEEYLEPFEVNIPE
jgi:chemotaxis methyl-accepting protein methylase